MRANLGALLVLTLAGCGHGPVEHVSAEGGFAVLLPGRPQVVESQPHREMRVGLRNGACTVAWQDLGADAEKDPDEHLDRASNGALSALGARQRSRKAIRLGGEHPGREVTAVVGENGRRLRARLYLVRGRLYQVVVTGAPGWVDSAEADAILESFRLTGE
jgi:hypothetical protein